MAEDFADAASSDYLRRSRRRVRGRRPPKISAARRDALPTRRRQGVQALAGRGRELEQGAVDVASVGGIRPVKPARVWGAVSPLYHVPPHHRSHFTVNIIGTHAERERRRVAPRSRRRAVPRREPVEQRTPRGRSGRVAPAHVEGVATLAATGAR